MNTYEEQLEVVKRETKKVKKSNKEIIWDLAKEMPLQWLEDYKLGIGFLPNYENPNQLIPDPDIFGVACYCDGSVASGFQIEATDPQFLSVNDANTIHTQLESAITAIRKDENIQFIWCALDEDEDSLKNFERDREGLKCHPAQAYTRKNLLKRERKRLAAGELKSYRAYCFLNTPATSQEEEDPAKKSILKTMFSSLKDIPAAILSEAKLIRADEKTPQKEAFLLQVEQNIEATKSLMAGFTGAPGISVKPINATQFYRMLRRSWSPGAWAGDKLLPGKTLETLHSPLRYSLPAYYLLEDVEDEWGWTWRTGDYWHRVLSLRIPPSFADVGTMIAQMVARENSEIYNSEYSLTLRPTKGTKAAQALHANLKLYRKQFEGNSQEHENLRYIIEGMSTQLEKLMRSDGSHVFEACLILHIWSQDPKELDRWESGLMRTFSMAPLKARFALEQFNALPYYAGFGTPGFTRCKDNHRMFTYLADEAVTHIPLLGESDGFVQTNPIGRRAPMLMETHRGTLYAQDDFARGRVNAFNGIAVGTTGSGKSMFYNLKIARTFSERDIIIVLDGAVAAGSYRSLAHILGGKESYIETGLDLGEKTHGKNPLFTERLSDGSYRAPTSEEIARMVNNIEPMVRTRPGQELTQGDRAQITAAVNSAFEDFREQGGKVFLRGVAKALQKRGRDGNDTLSFRAREMSQLLEDLWCYPRGTYWRFVDVESSPSPKNLTVYDLKGINEDETLKGVVVATYLNHIQTIVEENLRQPEEKRCRIWIIIDEGWKALMDPTMVQSLLGLYRAGRGRNLSVHCLTQQMADFKKILIASDRSTGATTFDPTNNAILGNTVWFNLFKHDPQDAKITQEVLQLAPNQMEELFSLGGKPGYREMIQYTRLLNGNAFNKLYVRPLPWELAAYTSDSAEHGAKITLQKEILQGWKTNEEAVRAREYAVAELLEAGFQGADQLTDEQIIEILTALRISRKK